MFILYAYYIETENDDDNSILLGKPLPYKINIIIASCVEME